MISSELTELVPEEKGEPEKHPGKAPSGTSSISSDEIINMEVEAEDVHEECSGQKAHSECWPKECLVKTMDQFDGAMTDEDTDEPEERGEPEKNPGRAPSDTSSVSSDEIIDMEVEAGDIFPEIKAGWSEGESQPEHGKDVSCFDLH